MGEREGGGFLTIWQQGISGVGESQHPGAVVPAVHGDGAGRLVDDVDPVAVGVDRQVPRFAAVVRVEVLDLLDRAGRLVHGVDPHAVAHVISRVEEVAVRAHVAAVDAGRRVVGRVGEDALQGAAVVDRDGQAGAACAVRGAVDGVRDTLDTEM